MMQKIFTSIVLISFFLISKICNGQSFSHSINAGINMHIQKSIRIHARPYGAGSYKSVSSYFDYKFSFKPKKANANFTASLSYRNNVLRYYNWTSAVNENKICHLNVNRPLAGFSLEIGNEFRIKNKSHFLYGCGIGALYSLNNILNKTTTGITYDYRYPIMDKDIDSSHYLISDIQTIELVPTLVAYLGYNYSLKSNLILCFGVRFETSFFEGQTQARTYVYYDDYKAYSYTTDYITTNNSSFIFSTGIKFSNNIFKKRG